MNKFGDFIIKIIHIFKPKLNKWIVRIFITSGIALIIPQPIIFAILDALSKLFFDKELRLNKIDIPYYIAGWVFIIIGLVLYRQYRKDEKATSQISNQNESRNTQLSILDKLHKRYSKLKEQELTNYYTLFELENKIRPATKKLIEEFNNKDEEKNPTIKFDLIQTLSKYKNLFFSGNAGSGKTVLLYQFAEQLIDYSKKQVDEGKQFPIPIILNLRTWNSNSENFESWLSQYLYEALKKTGIPKNEISKLLDDNFSKEKDTTRILLLLDGFDEIKINLKSKFLNEYENYVSFRLNKSFIYGNFPISIITGRNEVVKLIFEKSEINGFEIAELDKPDIINELKRNSSKGDNKEILLGKYNADNELKSILKTVFAVNIAIELAKCNEILKISNYNQLVNLYIKKETEKNSLKKTLKYLKFIAEGINETKHSSSFELSDIQPIWIFEKQNSYFYYYLAFYFFRFIFIIFLLIFSIGKHAAMYAGIIDLTLFFIYPPNAEELVVREQKRLNIKNGLKFMISFMPFIWSLIAFVSGITLGYFTVNDFLIVNKIFNSILVIIAFLLTFVGFIFLISTLLIVINKGFIEENSAPKANSVYSRFRSIFLFDSVQWIVIFIGFLFLSAIVLKLVDLTFINLGSVVLAGFITALMLNPICQHFIIRLFLYREKVLPFRIAKYMRKIDKTGLIISDFGSWRFKHKSIQDNLINDENIRY